MNQKLDAYLKTLKNKRILIQGLGINGGGVGTARFFLEKGLRVTITDLKKANDLQKSLDELKAYNRQITYVLGEHRESDFANADIVVKGPGVPPANPYIKIAMQHQAQIISDIEIFYNCIEAPVYAVTGSKGKSTTVSAIYHIFKQKSPDSYLGGNITISPLSFYEKITPDSQVILELSSWQLRDIKNSGINFKGSAITNLMNDHQNYYSGMDDYLADKVLITRNQSQADFLLIPLNDAFVNPMKIKTHARLFTFDFTDSQANFYFSGPTAYARIDGIEKKLFSISDIKLPGKHLQGNILIAAAFCYLAGIAENVIQEGIRSFKGVPYRLELIREWQGIKFYNDTTATIPEAAVNGILAFQEPVIWIGGGTDKNLDFSSFKTIENVPKKILLLSGTGTEKMQSILGRKDMIVSDSLDDLLQEAVKVAQKGDIVLLSPGCASFGLFQNEFHRGDVFNQWVAKLH